MLGVISKPLMREGAVGQALTWGRYVPSLFPFFHSHRARARERGWVLHDAPLAAVLAWCCVPSHHVLVQYNTSTANRKKPRASGRASERHLSCCCDLKMLCGNRRRPKSALEVEVSVVFPAWHPPPPSQPAVIDRGSESLLLFLVGYRVGSSHENPLCMGVFFVL